MDCRLCKIGMPKKYLYENSKFQFIVSENLYREIKELTRLNPNIELSIKEIKELRRLNPEDTLSIKEKK